MSWSEELASKDQQVQSEALDREVEKFSSWLMGLPDTRVSGPLNNPEKALLKTYLIQKITGKLDKEF